LIALTAVTCLITLWVTLAQAVTTGYKEGFFCTVPVSVFGARLTSDVWAEGYRYNGEVWKAAASGNTEIGISGEISCGNYTDITYSISIKAVGSSETRTLYSQTGTIADGGGSIGFGAAFDPRTEKGWFGESGGIQVSASVTIWSYSQAGSESTAYSSGTIGINYDPNLLSWNYDQLGGPASNRSTEFVGGGPGCPGSAGLPVYWVNTSFLSLVIEDTDFLWQSFGHQVGLTRVWNMLPGNSGMFGNGWSFAYESTIQTKLATGLDSGWARVVNLGSGQTHYYTVSGKQGTGTATVSFSCGSDCILPTLSGYLSDTTGIGYYLFEDKTRKLTSRYDYAGTADGINRYRLTSISDRNGHTLALNYDANGLLTKLTDASGREVSFTYGANGRVSQVQTFDDKTATYAYDSAGNLIENVDLAGNVIGYSYDGANLITSMTAAGKTTGFTYFSDASNERHVSTVTDALGKITRYDFGAVAGTTTRTEPGGGVWTTKVRTVVRHASPIHCPCGRLSTSTRQTSPPTSPITSAPKDIPFANTTQAAI
jgi:YD repeat-containing protein